MTQLLEGLVHRHPIPPPKETQRKCRKSGKVKFATEEQALAQIAYLRRLYATASGSAYLCRCGGWHITRRAA